MLTMPPKGTHSNLLAVYSSVAKFEERKDMESDSTPSRELGILDGPKDPSLLATNERK